MLTRKSVRAPTGKAVGFPGDGSLDQMQTGDRRPQFRPVARAPEAFSPRRHCLAPNSRGSTVKQHWPGGTPPGQCMPSFPAAAQLPVATIKASSRTETLYEFSLYVWLLATSAVLTVYFFPLAEAGSLNLEFV